MELRTAGSGCMGWGLAKCFGKELEPLRFFSPSYDYPPYRPPSEAGSVLIRATRGCPWNRCTFCSMYKGMKFEKRQVEDVLRDIDTALRLHGSKASSVFIGDSNSLVLGPESLEKILRRIHERFRSLERVTSYARARTLIKKSPQDLLRIRQAGLSRLHIGLETGSDELLDEIKKGASAEQMVEGSCRAKEAGFEVSLYVLAGIGGDTRWKEHADGTAAVLNRVNPDFIRIRTYVPTPGSPLWESVREDSFRPAAPETVLHEQRRLIEQLEVTSQYLSDHVSNYVPVYGRLPREKPQMLDMLDRALARAEKEPMSRKNPRVL